MWSDELNVSHHHDLTMVIGVLVALVIIASSSSPSEALSLSSSSSFSKALLTSLSNNNESWSIVNQSLRDPNVCVVSSPTGLDDHLSILREALCSNYAHTDLDLRMRVRCSSSVDDDNGNDDDYSDRTTLNDCIKIVDSVINRRKNQQQLSSANNEHYSSSVLEAALALKELALGVSSLADASFSESTSKDPPPDVHVRVACASDYRAIDPVFHTDKCPLRAYVTLIGPGTEYVDTTCNPLQYLALRMLGENGLVSSIGDDGGEGGRIRVKEAKEMEFIVMKGDRYVHNHQSLPLLSSSQSSSLGLWSRSSACVHRSPPGALGGGKRVIVSLDIANGEDDREWYETGRKREWRAGLTQRKSRLVS